MILRNFILPVKIRMIHQEQRVEQRMMHVVPVCRIVLTIMVFVEHLIAAMILVQDINPIVVILN